MNPEDIDLDIRQNIALFVEAVEHIKFCCVQLHCYEEGHEPDLDLLQLIQFLFSALSIVNSVEQFVAEGNNIEFMVTRPEAFLSLHDAVVEYPDLFPVPDLLSGLTKH